MFVEVHGTISKQKPPRRLTTKDGRTTWQTSINVRDNSEAGVVLITGYLEEMHNPGSEVVVLLDIPNDQARILDLRPAPKK